MLKRGTLTVMQFVYHVIISEESEGCPLVHPTLPIARIFTKRRFTTSLSLPYGQWIWTGSDL